MESQMMVKNLLERFARPGKGAMPIRILVWNDPERSFIEEIDQIAMGLQAEDIITIAVDRDQHSYLLVKKRIELDEPEQKFLLYFTTPVPKYEEDWFLDTRLTYGEFLADRASLLLSSLGLNQMTLRKHIAEREEFLKSKKRLEALKKLIVENDDERSLDLKMIAVVLGIESASIEAILLALIEQLNKAPVKEGSLFNDHFSAWNDLTKYGLQPVLWQEISMHFGYRLNPLELEQYIANPQQVAKAGITGMAESERTISLHRLLLAFFSIECDTQIKVAVKGISWQTEAIQGLAGRASVLAFLANWRDSRTYNNLYQQIAHKIGVQLNIEARLMEYQAIDLVDLMSFEEVEQYLIRYLVTQLSEPELLDIAQFEQIINTRIVGYWAKLENSIYGWYYTLLQQAQCYLTRSIQCQAKIQALYVAELYKAYQAELYQVDQAYRHYRASLNSRSDLLESKVALQPLTDYIERDYVNGFSANLNALWDRLIAQEDFLRKWRIGSDPTQEEFFAKRVEPEKREGNLKRIYVIVSDALRYEVAEELQRSLNQPELFKAELQSQLGVIPSYTQLGMASLLPHKTLSYKMKPNGAEYTEIVEVDGLPSNGLEARNKILAKVNGVAFHAESYSKMTREEEKQARGDCEYIYLYHNKIDAVGDNETTEQDTFKACNETIDFLKALVRKIFHTFQGSRVMITADHGFVFQSMKMDEIDRTELRAIDAHQFITKKKRYVVSNQSVTQDNVWCGLIRDTVKSFTGEQYFIVPKRWQRFHFAGGAQFVHGGISLQEITVPVITIRNNEAGFLAKQQPKQYVQASVVGELTNLIRITSNSTKIRIRQSEPVSAQILPRNVEIFIKDEAGNQVSNRVSLRLDSNQENKLPLEREVILNLMGQDFDRKNRYILVIQDEQNVEIKSYSVSIDLAFANDFF